MPCADIDFGLSFADNYQYPRGSNKTYPDAAMQQFAAIGIATSWRDPLVLTDKLLYQFENQNAGIGLCDGKCTSPACQCIPKNGSAGWKGWSMEGGELYFSKRFKRWRTIFHSFRKDFQPADELPFGIHSGGFAESRTADLLGDWTCYPPEVGAGYTKFVSAAGHEQVPRAPSPFTSPNAPKAAFVYGKTNMTQPAYLNTSLSSWGGNVHQESDGSYHMMLDTMVSGQAAGLGGWECNSEVIHAVSDRPEGPFSMKSVILPTQNTNPHLLYDPATQTYLLYTLSTGFGKCGAGMPASRQCSEGGKCIDGQCQGCHKGHCGPFKLSPAEPKHSPTVTAEGYVQLGRRERPKLLLDKVTGEPVMLYNGVQVGSTDQLVFTIATPMHSITTVPETVVTAKPVKTDDHDKLYTVTAHRSEVRVRSILTLATTGKAAAVGSHVKIFSFCEHCSPHEHLTCRQPAISYPTLPYCATASLGYILSAAGQLLTPPRAAPAADDDDAAGQQGIVNVQLGYNSLPFPATFHGGTAGIKFNWTSIDHTFSKYNTSSFIDMSEHGAVWRGDCSAHGPTCSGVVPGWQANIAVTVKEVKSRLASGAVAGLFLGTPPPGMLSAPLPPPTAACAVSSSGLRLRCPA